ncbi:MAG: hypothetical protein ACQXXL_00845 [Candidatus Methanosuratincola sp.]|jgi:uncharacterized membrane protein|nr:hypothetical protein [Candidatus Methanosuratincola sp.]
MKGALVFLVVFFAALVLTVSTPSIPPGLSIYFALGFPETDYPLLGIPAPTFAAAILNGVIYGIIAWLVYSLASYAAKPKRQEVIIKQEPPK